MFINLSFICQQPHANAKNAVLEVLAHQRIKTKPNTAMTTATIPAHHFSHFTSCLCAFPKTRTAEIKRIKIKAKTALSIFFSDRQGLRQFSCICHNLAFLFCCY